MRIPLLPALRGRVRIVKMTKCRCFRFVAGCHAARPDSGDKAMPQQLPQPEIQRLRWLARRQKEIADLPVMEKRRRRWAAVKEAAPGARPVFTLEHWTFNRDFMPASLLECQTPLGRQLEQRMLEHIRHHEIIDDDLPCPGHLDAGWHLRYDEFGGLRIPVTRARDAEGVETAYHYDCPIKDLAIDPIDFLDHPPAWSVDREATADEIRFLEELLGDLLPVRLVGWAPGAHNLTGRVIRLMDQAAFFVAMHEAPEKLRRVMRYLTDSAVQYDRWAEREGLLGVTNGGLPPAGARLGDMWVYMESQETVGVSPAFFAEFCFPYYREIAELFGHVYWGCCEPDRKSVV